MSTVQNYGYTDEEWTLIPESQKRAIRDIAWNDLIRKGSPTTYQTSTRTNYISNNTFQTYDATFGSYKYKTLFQNVRNFKNREFFQASEQELNEENLIRHTAVNPMTSYPELPLAYLKTSNSYSGCDIIPSISVGSNVFALGNISTISYSVHRDKVPVRTLGRTYPKGYAGGQVTIAGTLVFTVFDRHVLSQVREAVMAKIDPGNPSSSPITQQLPPFDVTIFFQNEYGHASYMRIYGVEISDEAQTHSINDIMTENVMQYVARDIDLMTEVKSVWTPQALAASNTVFRMASPSYRLRNIQENEALEMLCQKQIVRVNTELTRLETTITEYTTAKGNETDPDIILSMENQIHTLQIQYDNLYNNELPKLTSELIRLQTAVKTATESRTAEEDSRMGANTSATHADPFNIDEGVRTKPFQDF